MYIFYVSELRNCDKNMRNYSHWEGYQHSDELLPARLRGTQLQQGAHLLPGSQSPVGRDAGADPAYSGLDQLTGSGPERGTTLLKSMKVSRQSLKIKGVLLGSVLLRGEEKKSKGSLCPNECGIRCNLHQLVPPQHTSIDVS